MIESHINYIASAVAFLRKPGVGTVEVKPSVQHRFNERLQDEVGALGLGRGWLRQLVPRPSGPQHHAVARSHLEVPAPDPPLPARPVRRQRR